MGTSLSLSPLGAFHHRGVRIEPNANGQTEAHSSQVMIALLLMHIYLCRAYMSFRKMHVPISQLPALGPKLFVGSVSLLKIAFITLD